MPEVKDKKSVSPNSFLRNLPEQRVSKIRKFSVKISTSDQQKSV